MNGIGEIVGGLGLFLLALSMMTSGLRLAVGQQLISIMKHSTTPPWRGLISGISLTAILQSSSVVTVATIGFVNAGLLSLGQAVAVVIGTNIGTTMTGWLVALLGFEVNIAGFALPMVGLGMGMKLLYGDQPKGGTGLALAGFGLFFLGLDFLKSGFEGVSPSMNIQMVGDYGVYGLLLGVAVGIILTTLSQSSSAAIALILTAVQGDTIMLPTAAAMVVGANIGTSTTAIFATIGATPNAKRVALAHVGFNLVAALIAILVLLLMTPYAAGLAAFAAPAVLLALFHTGFNVVGTLGVWPLKDKLVAFLLARFRTEEEDFRLPHFLDHTLVTTPTLAVQALLQEVARVDNRVTEMITQIFDEKDEKHDLLQETRNSIWSVVEEIYQFGSEVQRANMSVATAEQLASVLKAAQYYLEATGLAIQVKGIRANIQSLNDPNMKRRSSRFVNMLVPIVVQAEAVSSPLVCVPAQEEMDKLENSYQTIKAELLNAVMNHEVLPGIVNEFLETISTLNRIVPRIAKARRLLNSVAHETANHAVVVDGTSDLNRPQ